MAERRLKELNVYLCLPTLAGAFLGVSLSLLYVITALDPPEENRTSLLGVVALVAGLSTAIGWRQFQSRLMSLRGLDSSKSAPPTLDALTKAARETFAFPDVTFRLDMYHWIGSSVAVTLVFGMLPGVSYSFAAHVGFIGIAVGPLVALLAYVWVVRRARDVLGRLLAAGLPPSEMVGALPLERLQLGTRLQIYAAISVGTPLALVLDLCLRRIEGVISALEVAHDEGSRAAILDSIFGNDFLVLAASLGLVVVVTVLACGAALGAALSEPMRRLAHDAQRLAEGKLGEQRLIAGEDELWATSVGFLRIEEHLQAAVLGLSEATGQIADASRALVSSSARQELGAKEQATALEQTSSTTEGLAKSARHIAVRANQVADLAQRTLSAAKVGKGQADGFYQSVLKVREGNQAIADSVVRLNKRVQQIGRIVEFIDGIADQSDLLALNAELEGHKAGDVGRGFSLVAAEMRRLSESVMTSTREIVRLIDEVRDATHAAVMATEAGVKASDAGSVLAQQVSTELSRILQFAAETSDAVQAISLATHQQQLGSDQLAETMADIFTSTRAATESSRQITQSQGDLVTLSDELKATVGRFKVGEWS